MKKISLIFASSFLLSYEALADVVVIANQNIPKLDQKTVAKAFTGKIISVNGVPISVVNLKNQNVKNRFLQTFLGLDEEKYAAYWTVRKYIGKGVPPRELSTPEEVIRFIQNTPGAIGYVEESDIRCEVNIVAR